jgi:DNA mismatch repair protein MSH4
MILMNTLKTLGVSFDPKNEYYDAYHVKVEHNLAIEMKYETRRQFYIRVPTTELSECELPVVFTNCIKQKGYVECQTLDLLKFNQKVGI